MEGGDGGGGERWRRRRRAKGGGREAKAEHRSDVDAEAGLEEGDGGSVQARGFVLPPKQKRPTKQRVNIMFVHRNWYGTA